MEDEVFELPKPAHDKIKALLSKWASERDERARIERLTCLAAQDMVRSIRPMPAEPDWHTAVKPKVAAGLVALALRQLSYLYDEAPSRVMVDERTEAWAREKVWTWGVGLDVVQSHADSMARLHDVCLVRLKYRDSHDAAAVASDLATYGVEVEDDSADGIEASVVTRDKFVTLTLLDAPTVMDSCLVHVATRRGAEGQLPQLVFEFWDRLWFARILVSPLATSWETEVVAPNDYGMIPFLVYRNFEGGSEFYPRVGSWGGRDLESNIMAINDLLTEYGWTAKLQRGQPWTNGRVDNNALAPDAVLVVEPGSQFGIASNGANLQGIRDAISLLLGSLAKTLGLPSRSLRITDSAGESGVAILLDRAELADDRRSREKLAAGWERALHRLAARIYEVETGEEYDPTITVAFPPLTQTLSVEQTIEALRFELTLGLTTRAEAIQRLHPEMSRAEAEERAAEAWAEYEERLKLAQTPTVP